MELFFDLVYVFAITQLSHHLVGHLTIRGALETGLLLLAVWAAWIYTAWMTNWCDPDHPAVRFVLIGVMLASLVMAAAIPTAFEERGLLFGAAYAISQVGRTAFLLYAVRGDEALRRNFQRILVWLAVSGLFWIGGGLADGSARPVLWLIAAGFDFGGPAARFWVPGMGRSLVSDWAIAGTHLAERCQLFLIVALGESILVTGATFAGLDFTTSGLVAFLLAFLGSVALWWIYFDRSAEAASARIAAMADPGRLGRSAYTYFHLPMVAGVIVVAVADELVIAHPDGHADPATIAVVLGGPALFLAGHALFKRAAFGHLSTQRLLGLAALAILVPVGGELPPVVLGLAATLVIVGVATWDTIVLWRMDRAAEAGSARVGGEAEPVG